MQRMASLASAEATHTESKAENKYDTRGLEASYLAAGQARRVVELRRIAAFFDRLVVKPVDGPAGVGSLIETEEDGVTRWLFLAPEGGGTHVDVGGVAVRLVTPSSPLGRELVGAESGDEIEVEMPRLRRIELLSVR